MLLAGLGLACLWLPWSTHVTAERELPGARVRPAGRVLPAGGQLPPNWVSLDPISAGEVPATAALLDSAIAAGSVNGTQPRFASLPGHELRALLPADESSATDLDIAYRDHHIRLEGPGIAAARLAMGLSDGVVDMPVSVRIAELEPLLPAMVIPAVPAARLARSPALAAVIDGNPSLERRLAHYPGDFVTDQELEPLQDDTGALPSRFVFASRVFELAPDTALITEARPVPQLRLSLRLIGVVALAAAIVMAAGLYRRHPEGIPLASTGSVLAADLVLLLFCTLSWVALVDVFLQRRYGTELLMVGEGLLVATGASMLLVAMPVGALHNTALLAQWLQVDPSRLRLSTWRGTSELPWSDLQEIDTSTSWVLVGRVGWIIPRRFETRLVFRGVDTELSLKEPTARTRRRILDELRRHAPASWTARIDEVAEDWI